MNNIDYSALAEQDDPHSVIDARIVKLINIVGLLNEAKSLHAQLQPVANALDRLQSDSATIADACEEWLSLLTAHALKPHLTTVMKRFKEAVTDNHFLENLLHPRYKAKYLSEADEEACTTAALEASSEASRSYRRSVCIHRRFRPVSSFASISRMC